MKSVLFFTFLTAVAKSAVIACIGLLVKDHFIAFLTLITRKAIPESEVESVNSEKFNNVLKWIGIAIIALGVCMTLTAFASFIAGIEMSSNRLKLNF
ncbi:hypothetical protein RBH94_15420 [Aestuariibaculum sp. YM273]|uniref:hypothetical protein n=1 Tax=Aestuariibaculum sp. YM273 TaxID=3070659 RepID=UPI0027DE1904|nr:hypothetical protein [Aestuariibaculum sp. YM273]WMI65441.1 hypothetical protein RBH94_15420 [Aestuariibaculum sp. YM273]